MIFFGHNPEYSSPVDALKTFFLQRIQTLLTDELNLDYDVANAVLGEGDLEYEIRALQNLLDVRERALFLQQIRKNGQLTKIYEIVNRSTRLAAKGDLSTEILDPTAVVSSKLFEKPSEQAFYDALIALVPESEAARADRNYQRLLDSLTKIAPTVNEFFDGPDSVLVMDKNPAIKENRLNLLGLLRNHSRILADFAMIVKGM